MKYLPILVLALLISSCAKFDNAIEDPLMEVEDNIVFTARSSTAKIGNFRGHLSGEVSNATGQVNFKFNADNSVVHYKLIVANIEDVVASHLHHSHMGSMPGHPVLPLFSGLAEDPNGVLAEGYLTDEDISCPCSDPTHHNLAHLRKHIEDGETTVLVHTVAHPGGEISGAIH